MGRKKVEINPVSGKRVKMICEEKKITQEELANKLFLSKKTVSGMVNSRCSVTYQTATDISRLFPEYSVDWILGRSESRNAAEEMKRAIIQANDEGQVLESSVMALIGLAGFNIVPKLPASDSTAENVLNALKAGFTFSRDGKEVSLSIFELNSFENEICDYVQFRLEHMMK